MCFSPSSPCSGESGCTEMSTIDRDVGSRSRRPVPMKVPLVPSAATKWVTRPASAPGSPGRWCRSAPASWRRCCTGPDRSSGRGWRHRGAAPRRIAPSVPSIAIGEDQLGAVGGQDPLALGLAVARHAERHREAEGRAEHGVGDPGVARGGVEQRAAGREGAASGSRRAPCAGRRGP